MKFLDNLDIHKLLKSCHVYWKGALILCGFLLLFKLIPSADAEKPKVIFAVSGTVTAQTAPIEKPKSP